MSDLILINIHAHDEDGKPTRFRSAVTKSDGIPFWRIADQLPDKMLCPAGTTSPFTDLHFNLSALETNAICYDAHPWTEEHQDLREQIRELHDSFFAEQE